MASIIIKDLQSNRTLDRATMARVRGAGGTGAWVAFWMTPYSGASSTASAGGVYNITNTIIANQVTFQNQTTEVLNSGANSIITAGPAQASTTVGH